MYFNKFRTKYAMEVTDPDELKFLEMLRKIKQQQQQPAPRPIPNNLIGKRMLGISPNGIRGPLTKPNWFKFRFR